MDYIAGTFGMVLECWDRITRCYVAIKIIRNIEKYRRAAMVEVRSFHIPSHLPCSYWKACPLEPLGALLHSMLHTSICLLSSPEHLSELQKYYSVLCAAGGSKFNWPE